MSDLNEDDAKGADVTQLADRLLGSQRLQEGKKLEIATAGIAAKASVGNAIATDGSSAITPRAVPVSDGFHKVTPEEVQATSTSPMASETGEGATIMTSSSSSASKPQFGGSSATTKRLPVIGEQLLCREFTMQDQLNGVEITSLDITSHGCYVLAGCGNGMVLLFDLTQKLKEPACVGQILAKGLHTNLLMTVKITEDGRYCFAGVTKGSSELLALDLSRLPIWNAETGMGHCCRPYGFVNELVTCHSRSDPKLRGFGDAVRVRGDRHNATYRLASGLGIKNIHVWQFTPSKTAGEAPVWTCMYDVATNGNTIESISFKMGGEYLSSKSAGVNLRVWDLTGYDETSEAANNKPAYEDIANTQDSRALLDDYALGGTYEFAVVNLKAPKAANKDALEVPQRSADDADGNRRRRMMRQISSISATHDSQHAIVLCADGGCLYFNKSAGKEEGDASSSSSGAMGSLLELPSLPRDMDNLSQCTGRDWTLKRVGYQGEVVLLHATQAKGDQPVKMIVRPIYLESMDVPPTVLGAPVVESAGKDGPNSAWSEWGYFWNPEAAKPLPPEVDPTPASAVKAVPHSTTSTAAVAATESATGAKKRGRKEKGASIKALSDVVHEEEDSAPKKGPGAPRGRPPLAPSGAQSTGAKRPRKEASDQRAAAHKASNEEYRKSLQLPSAAAKSSAFGYGWGFGQTGVNPEDCANDSYEDYAFRFEQEPKMVCKPLVIGPPPRARRVVEAPFSRGRYLVAPSSSSQSSSQSSEESFAYAKPKQPSVANMVMGRFRGLCKHWIQSQSRRPRGGAGEILFTPGGAAEVGVCTLRKLGELGVQQDRVRAQFIGEATRVIAKHLNTLNDSHGGAYLSSPEDISYSQQSQDSTVSDLSSPPLSQGMAGVGVELPLGAAAQEIEVIIGRYEGVVRELMQRQQLEIGATYAMDSMTSPAMLFSQSGAIPRRQPQVMFRHGDCWDKARSFVGTVQLLVNSVIAQFRKEQGTVAGPDMDVSDGADHAPAAAATA